MEVTTNQLATVLPITLTYESLSWTIKLNEILVDDWKTRWVIDEQKMETLIETIASEVETTIPLPY